MTRSRFDEHADFINNLPSTTGKTLGNWFEVISASKKNKFLDIRKWLQDKHKLATKPATNLAMLYDEHLENITPVVWLYTNGRGGDVGYKGPEGRLNTEWVVGSGDILAIVDIPTKENWFVVTGIFSIHREPVVETFGRLLLERETGGRGSFEVQENRLLIRS